MSIPLEHDYIGLTDTTTASAASPREKKKIMSSSSSSSSAVSTTTEEEDKKSSSYAFNLKETELRLGLPGSHSPDRKVSIFGKDLDDNNTNLNININNNININGIKVNGFSLNPLKTLVSGAKRGYADAIDGCTEKKWGFGSEVDNIRGANSKNPLVGADSNSKKDVAAAAASVPPSPKAVQLEKKNPRVSEHAGAPAAKAQVVGWPPIRSFRKNSMASNMAKNNDDAAAAEGKQGSGCLYVKVSMDGAPYLRKVDLKIYNNYTELSMALEKMFSCFTIGQCSSNGLPGQDGLSASRLMDLLHGSEFVLTYEDKDDDWMLVGDVPWEMFTETCRRLRIMKGSDAIGLAPRAVEKCKNRN